MNIDNQLILGVIFITAGIALALLAYAAYLNRQEPSEDEADAPPGPVATAEPDAVAKDLGTEVEQAGAEAGKLEPTEPEEEPPSPVAPPEETEAQEQPAPSAETVSTAEQPAPPAEPTHPAAPATLSDREQPPAPPTVQLRRDEPSDRLVVDIESRTYRSMEELRASSDWESVSTLFSDILAWMIKEETSAQGEAEPSQAQPGDSYPEQAKSMVEQINEVLKRKLAERESGPRAVRLAEGIGGAIRVYVGVDSFAMDEVPDEEVNEIIRQAVKEWEEQQ